MNNEKKYICINDSGNNWRDFVCIGNVHGIDRRMECTQGKAIGATLIGIVGALLLGVGMCLTMVWSGYMVIGIIVGIVGIVVLLCLIPFIKGLK